MPNDKYFCRECKNSSFSINNDHELFCINCHCVVVKVNVDKIYMDTKPSVPYCSRVPAIIEFITE